MAEMIPESISVNSEATNGEKKVFRVLQEALIPDQDYLVWYEPKVIDRYTDFLIFSQHFGMLIVEVKDWVISNINEFNPLIFKGTFHNIYKEVKNPLAQAREVANKIMSLLQKIPSLINQDGDHLGKLKFPVGYAVIFTNMTRIQAKEKGLYTNTQILGGENQAIFSDDINFETDDKELCRNFISKLKHAFLVKYNFNPLSYPELNSLRYAIFPEVRVNVHKIRRLRTEKDEELLKTLDLEQEKTAKSLGEGHRILKGVAGSGKTLVLACRVKYLKQIHPNWKILIVCYNISLRQYLKTLIDISGENIKDEGIDIFHFHGLVREFTGANLSKLPTETDEEYDSRVGEILKGRIAEGIIKKGLYDAIFVDEGQDFATEWMQGLSKLLNENTDSLLFCYDPAQNVFGRKKPNWKTAGFKVQGKKPTELKKSYRNTVEILKAATAFSKMETQVNQVPDDLLDITLFPEVATNRHGDVPLLRYFSDDIELCQFIIKEIETYINDKICNWADIGILYTEWSFPDLFISLFSDKFGSDKIYWVTRNRDSKLNLAISSTNVKLLTIESCKGLEFKVIFFVGLEEMPKQNRTESSQRSLAYVGLTRAQDVLYITAKSKLGYISEIEPILKKMDKEVIEEENLII